MNRPSKPAFILSSLSGVVQLLFVAALVLVSVPVFIWKLGSEAYGVFAVVSLILTLPVFTGLGLNRSLIKFIARQGRSRESDHDMVVTLSILLFMFIPVICLFFLFKDFLLVSLFGVPGPFVTEADTLLTCLLFSSLLLLLGQAFSSVLAALQMVWLVNLLQMIYNVLFYGSMIILLLLGSGLADIGCGILASAGCWLLLSIWFALRHWGPVSTGGLLLNYRRLIRKQLGYGMQVYFAEGVAWFVEPVSKILLSNFIGISEAGFFDIAIRVKAQFQGLLTRLLDPFFPYISQVQEQPRLQRIIADVERKFLLLSLPLVALLIFALPPLLDLWLGAGNNREITLAALFITGTFLVTTSVLPFYYYLLSKDQSPAAIRINLLTVIFNAALFFVFLKGTGFYASVVALCGSALINFIASLHYQEKLLETGIFTASKQRLNLFVAFLIMIAVNGLLMFIFHDPLLLTALLVVATVTMMILAYRHLRIIRPEDIISYFGNDTRVTRKLVKMFVKGTRDTGHGARDA